MNRPVDQALRSDRAAKRTVRMLWVDEVKKYPSNNAPMYLTLPGADGKDIELLIEEGIIARTDTGAIAENDRRKVIAVESNSEAVLSLQRKFVGLKIHDAPIQSIMGGAGPYTWPNSDVADDFRAKVINIDLDKALKAEHNGAVTFPIINIIQKISQLHCHRSGRNTPEDWSLCLTVNSTITWPTEAVTYFFSFLGENCTHHANFNAAARATFGDELIERLINDPLQMSFDDLSPNQKRALLCVFLPKLIMAKINDHGWSTANCRALCYGEPGEAPMTTITLSFSASNHATPGQRYEANICKIFEGLGYINGEGRLVELVAA